MNDNNENKLEEKPSSNINISKNSTELKIHIFNIVEDEWSFIAALNEPAKRYEYISDVENGTDAYFIETATSTDKDFIYISPKPINTLFQKYSQEIFQYKLGLVLVPALRSHLICDDFIEDTKTFNELISIAKNYKKVILTSYVASYQFYSLKEQLERIGIPLSCPEAPEYENAWTVNYFGSKSGIRQLAQKSQAAEPDFMMAEGIICVGKHDAAKIAANIYLRERGVVIKTNKGSGGNGVLILRDGELSKDYRQCIKEILALMNERYWDIFPIIIEDLINVNSSIAGGMPNVEFKIHKNGKIEMLYVCGCEVTPKGKFLGIDINEDIINDRLQTRIEDTGYYIAEKYSQAGYRGHFDIDFVYAKNGHVYVCESNTRHTGGTDTYKIARKLLGKDFMYDGYTLSRSRRHLFKERTFNFQQILDLLSPVIYKLKTKEGLIINSENSINSGHLIYTIIAKNKKRAYEYENHMLNIFSNESK